LWLEPALPESSGAWEGSLTVALQNSGREASVSVDSVM